MSTLDIALFTTFGLILVGLLFYHDRKLVVVVLGFLALVLLFLQQASTVDLIHHFAEPDRKHLLINLAFLLPGFSLVAHFFESSGLSMRLASSRFVSSDVRLLWLVFFLSIFLDNIAAAMIGASLLVARYGTPSNVPFRLIVGIIMASNLGGAASFLGDTTTVMIWISGVSPLTLARGFLAVLPAQICLTWWASRHIYQPLIVTNQDIYGEAPRVQWGLLLPLLGVPGLFIGNLFDQPALGLWCGLGLGLLIGLIPLHLKLIIEALPSTAFLVILVACAELLPLHALAPHLATMRQEHISLSLGLLSAWFDNIPLTAVALSLGKDSFDWALLAYCVGVGGSATWFGSSAGVAVGKLLPQAHDSKKWFGPFFVVTGLYLLGASVYLLITSLMRS